MDEYKKIYIGNGKEIQYGIQASIDINKIPPEAFKEVNGKKYLNFFIGKAKEVKFGQTHYVSISIKNEIKAQRFQAPPSLEPELAPETAVETNNQIPF